MLATDEGKMDEKMIFAFLVPSIRMKLIMADVFSVSRKRVKIENNRDIHRKL